VKPFNTHVFSSTSSNKTAVYHSSTMSVAQFIVQDWKGGTLPTEASTNWRWNSVTGNTIGLPVPRSVVCVCSAPPTAPICVRTETENTLKLQSVLADQHIKQCEHWLMLTAIFCNTLKNHFYIAHIPCNKQTMQYLIQLTAHVTRNNHLQFSDVSPTYFSPYIP